MSESLSQQGTAHGLIQTARGLCTDEAAHVEIDALLARAVDAVKDIEAERDRYRDRLREALTVVRGLVEPTNGCHDEIRAVVDAALEGLTDA